MSVDHVTHLIIVYRYWIIIPLSFVEGPIIAFVAGTLSFLGYFNPYLMFGIFLVRDIVLDSLMYAVGRFGGQTRFAQKTLARIGVTPKHLGEIHRMWERHGFRTMFFSKLSYGVSAAFLIVAGLVETSFSRFLIFGILVSLAQYGLLFVLGYFFGSALGTVSNVFTYVQYLVLAASVVGIGWYVFTRFIRKEFDKERDAEQQ
ncbi:MAG TPA: VTT domain-containing protein [Candidatus Paceibacterota bacterium]|nr:VTT domain-containing protein [Candidatus Paceibacterota bacterium]